MAIHECDLSKLIANAVEATRRSWLQWDDVLNHQQSVTTNPLLTSEDRFSSFLAGFAVARTIRRGTRNQLRLQLIDALPFAVEDATGRSLDQLELELRPNFGTFNGQRRIISALSKISAFVRPERFVARDSYSMKGLNLLLGRSHNRPFRTYAEYLQDFDSAWSSNLRELVEKYLIAIGTSDDYECEPRFLRRVADIYLMQIGDVHRKLDVLKD